MTSTQLKLKLLTVYPKYLNTIGYRLSDQCHPDEMLLLHYDKTY